MSFEFSLHSLLRVRRSIEKREELALAVVLQNLLKLRREMEEADEAISRSAQAMRSLLIDGTTSSEYRLAETHLKGLIHDRAGRSQQLAEIERLKLAQQSRLIACRRNRRMLESLQASRLEEYLKVESRREQQRQDDQFNSRRDVDAQLE